MENKIVSISFVRVVAMISIIAGHYLAMKGIYTYQLLSIGVEIFLLISGHLYGYRGGKITSGKRFFTERVKRIIVPLWMTLLLNIMIRLIIGIRIEWKCSLIYLLGLQGVKNIFRYIDVLCGIKGLGQTWFVTVIMACYIIMYILRRAGFDQYIALHWKQWLCIIILCQIVLAYLGIQISYFIEFFIGYGYAKLNIHNNSRLIKPVTVTTIIFGIIRIVSWKVIDGTILYDYIIARLSFNVLAVWLVLIQVWACNQYKNFFERIVKSTFWKTMDVMSYPMFLCHYMFCSGDFAVVQWCRGNAQQLIVFIVLTILASVTVTLVTNKKKLLEIFIRKQQGVAIK